MSRSDLKANVPMNITIGINKNTLAKTNCRKGIANIGVLDLRVEECLCYS